jgi:hypothetical protein
MFNLYGNQGVSRRKNTSQKVQQQSRYKSLLHGEKQYRRPFVSYILLRQRLAVRQSSASGFPQVQRLPFLTG